MLGVPPHDCLAVEDSTSGVASAIAAGVTVYQLRATATAAPPVPGIAGVLHSLAEFPYGLVGCD
jgi:beta-phosphoglucomutase-like phosphatase (HAD superfamily)